MKRIEDILKEKLAGGQSAGHPGQDASLWAGVQSDLSAAAPQPVSAAARGLSALGRGALFAGGLVVGVALGVAMGLQYGQPAEEAAGRVASPATSTPAPTVQDSPSEQLAEVASDLQTFGGQQESQIDVEVPVEALVERDSSFVYMEDGADAAPWVAAEDPPSLLLMKRRQIDGEAGPMGSLLPMNHDGPQNHEFFAIRTYGGAVWSAFAYDSPELAPMNESMFGDWGAAAGVAVDLDLFGQSWSIGLGAEHLVQRLAFDRTWTETITEPNGSVSTTTYRREVRRYNHIKSVVVPLEWRVEMVRPRWTLGAALGGQLLLRTDARGHAFLADGEVTNYGDGDLPRFRLNWAPTTRLYVGHHFAPAWRVDLSLGASWQGFRSAGLEHLDNPDLAPWQGDLRSCRIQAGLTRFIRR